MAFVLLHITECSAGHYFYSILQTVLLSCSALSALQQDINFFLSFGMPNWVVLPAGIPFTFYVAMPCWVAREAGHFSRALVLLYVAE